jgi:hypothetical protein
MSMPAATVERSAKAVEVEPEAGGRERALAPPADVRVGGGTEPQGDPTTPGAGVWAPSVAAGLSIATREHSVAMTLVTFLVLLAAALMQQGALSGDAMSSFFFAGVGAIGGALALAVAANRRFRQRVRTLSAGWGLREDEALALVRTDLERAPEDVWRLESKDGEPARVSPGSLPR